MSRELLTENEFRFVKAKRMPETIYVEGKLPDENVPTVAIVGARFCSSYGRYVARQYGIAMGRAGFNVLTDLSLGVGGIAAQGALQEGGKVFAVLGSGCDVCYPPENMALYEKIKATGGIISSFPDGTVPRPENFLVRPSLMCALADAIIVIESRRKAATLRILEYTDRYEQLVYAVPGRITDRLSDGVNDLLKHGMARLALDPEEVANEIAQLKGVAA